MKPAVAYYRMSSSKQEASIPSQRNEVVPFAKKNGYKIIREYIDEGISGDATEKRFDFQKMIADAQNLGDFEAILCWDQDRFGRFDSLEAGYWIKPLRDRGILLVTIGQGVIDWNDFAGRMLDGIQQEGKNQFLRDLSRNIVRGICRRMDAGHWGGGHTPYGFDKMYCDADGQLKQRVRNGEPTSIPRGWHAILVPSDNAEQIAAVRSMYQTYSDEDIGLRGLALLLNGRGVRAPGGGYWLSGTIRRILENPCYVGDTVANKRSRGKYYRVSETGPQPSTDGGRQIVNKHWTIKPNTHDGIIGRDLWEFVQSKLIRRRERRSTAKARDAYLLTGLLRCGHCGARLHGCSRRYNRKGRDGRGKGSFEYIRYICSAHMKFGRTACDCYQIRQDVLEPFVISTLLKIVFASGKFEKMVLQEF